MEEGWLITLCTRRSPLCHQASHLDWGCQQERGDAVLRDDAERVLSFDSLTNSVMFRISESDYVFPANHTERLTAMNSGESSNNVLFFPNRVPCPMESDTRFLLSGSPEAVLS